MSYLYGDSTPSPLEINFIEFLGDFLDFSAQLVASTESIRREGEKGDALRRAAQADIGRLERLAGLVSSAVKEIANGHADDHTTRCAVSIVRSASDLARTEIEQVSSMLAAELAKVDAATSNERGSCVKALETLLMRHDFPQTRRSFALDAKPGGAYAARIRLSTPFGVAATLDLEVASSHLFAHSLRVDRIVERLEVQAPDVGGWLHKEVRIRPQRLEKLYVVRLDLDGERSSIKLRSNVDGTGQGFDVIFRSEAPRVQLVRTGDREVAAEQPFDVGEADEATLHKLLEKLESPARDLAMHRKALVEATLDDRPLAEHDGPSILVERVVAAIAPVTQEIARRSPSGTELVLKRLVSGGRREEIFVTKAELSKRLEGLAPSLRAVFGPLGLGDANGAMSSTASRSGGPPASETPQPGGEPATLVMARRSPGVPESSGNAPVSARPSSGDVGVAPNGHVGIEPTRNG